MSNTEGYKSASPRPTEKPALKTPQSVPLKAPQTTRQAAPVAARGESVARGPISSSRPPRPASTGLSQPPGAPDRKSSEPPPSSVRVAREGAPSSEPARERREDTSAIVRAAVEEAIAPLRLRLGELEQRSLEMQARLALSLPPRAAPPIDVPAPPTLPPLVAAFTISEPTPVLPPDDATWAKAGFGIETWLDGDRRRRRTVLALAGAVTLALVLFFGVLAASS